MKDFFNNDKNLVILTVATLGLCLMFAPDINPEVLKTITPIFTGLFGIAIGQGSK